MMTRFQLETTLIPAMTILEGDWVKSVTDMAPPLAFSPSAANPLTTVEDRVCHLGDEEGEEADQEHLAHERGQDVLGLVDRPEHRGQGDGDHHQGAQRAGDVALDQPGCARSRSSAGPRQPAGAHRSARHQAGCHQRHPKDPRGERNTARPEVAGGGRAPAPDPSIAEHKPAASWSMTLHLSGDGAYSSPLRRC